MHYKDLLNKEDYQIVSIFEITDNIYVCSTCGDTLPSSEFYVTPKVDIYGTCKECHKFWRKCHYLENKDHTNQKVYEYQRKSRKRKDWFNKYHKKRKDTDPLFNLIVKIRKRTKIALRTKKFKKEDSITKSIGCNLEELKKYFESQFTEGMSWERVFDGSIHIDHRIPLSSAKTEEELLKLNHYTNLQPLWAEDNLKKSNKL